MFSESFIAKFVIDSMFILVGLSIFGLMYAVINLIARKYFKMRYNRRIGLIVALIATCLVIFALLVLVDASIEIPDQQ